MVKIIGIKGRLEEGKVYEVSQSVADALIVQGVAYLEGEEKPKAKRTRK